MTAGLPSRQALEALQDVLLASREKVFNNITRGGSLVALLAFGANALITLPTGQMSLFALYSALFVILLAVTLGRRLPFWFRSGTLLFLVYALALIDIFNSGVASGNGRSALLAFSLLTTILFGAGAGLWAAILSLLTWFGAGALFSYAGMQPPFPRDSAALFGWIDGGANLLLFLVALNLPYREFLETQMLAALQTFQKRELLEAQTSLEQQQQALARTTQELVQANERLSEQSRALEGRISQLAVGAGVARTVASLHNLPQLFQTTVTLIHERFGFYHAGIFLLDDAREWAVLEAANSAGGQRMLARGHRLRVGEQGIVGYVTATGRPRIALDVGRDAVHFLNADLPDTHSEMAVPLIAHGEIIGALEVQSTEVNAFTQADVEVLQILADQLAVAIDNARLFQETQRRLQELQALQHEPPPPAHPTRPERPLAYRYDGVEVMPSEVRTSESANDAAQGSGQLHIPINVGDYALGILELTRADENWSADDLELTQAIAERMGLALENARLFETTRATLADTARLYKATRAIAAAQNLNDILRAVVTHAMETGWEWFMVGLLETGADRAPTQLQIAATWNRGADAAYGELGKRYSVEDFPLLQQITPTSTILISSPDAPELDERSRAVLSEQGVQAAAFVPVAAGSSPIAVFCMGTREPSKTFTTEETRPMQALADQAATAIEKLRLLEETQQRIAELATLNSISQVLTSQLETGALLDQVGDKIMQAFGAQIGYIGLYDPQTQLIEFPYSMDTGVRQKEAPILLGQGLTSIVIRSCQPLLINHDAERRAAELGAKVVGEPAKSYLGVPILVGDRAIGLISLQSTEQEGLFREADIRLLSTIAANVGVAIENARLFEETQQRVGELALLNEISQIVTSQRDLETLLNQVGHKILEAFSAPNGFIALYDSKTNLIEIPFFVEKNQVLSVDPFPLGEGLSSIILRTRQPLLINRDAERRATELGAKFTGSNPAKSFLGVPILVGNEAIGVINIQSSEEEGLFSAADVRPLSTIAANIGVAIQNARLFEETQHRAQQLATAAEVSRASISVLNPDELIVRAVELIRERFDLYYAAIFLVDEAGEWAVLQHATGEAGRKLLERGHRLAVGGQSMVGWAVANHQARIALDVGLERVRFVNPLLPETRSEMALPLAVGNTVLGALDVQSTQPNAFSESDITVLQNMADQVATAIQNARLFKAIAQERESLALLYDLLRALSVSLEMTTTVNTTLRFAPRLGAQHAYILLLGNTEEETIFRSTVPGLDQLSVTQAREFALTLERWVLENRRPAVVADTREDERWYTAPSHVDPQGEPARSVISVPLQSQRGTLAGVLAYTHSEPGALTEAQLPLIESIAGLVSVALENARLYDQIRTQRFHASALARAAQTMSRTLSETDLLQALAAELFETYRPNGVIVYRWDAVLDTLTPVVTRINPEELQRERWPVVGQSVAASERPDLLAPILNREGAILPIRQESEYQVRESMSMPLIYSGQVEVVVEVIYTGPQHGLSQDDLSLFKDILNAASSAMQTIRLYELQRHTAERLAEVDRLKSQFLANMSHELRTPLNSIIGFSRVILKGIDGPITELQTQDLTSIYNAGQHLLGLINDILDMSRIEAGKMELVFDEVDLRDILKGVLSTTTALIKDKPIVLQDDIAPNLPTVRADSMRVRQVLLNLLANAAKFTESGSITLRARTVPVSAPHDGTIGRFVEISVMDTGQGIPQKDMSKLFEAFSQVDASPTRKVGGTGLGLSICRNLVELHGGRIWGESEGLPGRGATFSFTLPIYQPELTTPLEPMQVPEGAPVILVVDDDQGLLSLYRRYLEPHGYKIVGVSRSAEVLPRALEHKPVAILLDVIMPNQNGWQVLADLKQNPVTRDIPVIMCTIATDQARALSLGAADYLVKPILESDLLQAFNRLQISGLMPKNGNGERHELQVIK